MLSTLIHKHYEQHLQYADYIGNKATNHLIMKNFSLHHNSCFFGLNPDAINDNSSDLGYLLDFILNTDTQLLNGRVFKLSAEEDENFWKFN
jgi:hypothetical protein